ncbi:conserved membrane hypothetical protein [Pseudomonas sp. 8Z]|uniref:hypothetical protein n=1 Tax=Pseudomonas sp. 8Z TaxID=2653166 RepID=UPI0012EFA752|nr:hypothetical protein [Pseudomonas sp. 8Z]VXC73538.1 conserved membrane hypothetical protein [Pseudomonas sp. 8Z]
MIKRLAAIALLAVLQPLLALALYQGAFEAYRQMAGSIRRDISYGLQLQHSLYVFAALALGNAIWLTSGRSRRSGLIGTGICLSLWTLYWANIFASMPLRSVLVVSVGVLVLLLPAVLLQRRF